VKKSINLAFGRTLRKLRKARKLSQEKLAYEASLDRTYISLLELGRSSPTLESMAALAQALSVSLSELAAETEKSASRRR
jgi:transcriptional regulator with XRE-family HTH domain